MAEAALGSASENFSSNFATTDLRHQRPLDLETIKNSNLKCLIICGFAITIEKITLSFVEVHYLIIT